MEEKRRPPCQELCGFCFATSRFVTAHRTDAFVYFLFSGSWRLDSCMNISMYLFFITVCCHDHYIQCGGKPREEERVEVLRIYSVSPDMKEIFEI